MKWINIVEVPNPGRKTKKFEIHSKEDDSSIGIIKWYGPWRKYCFFPLSETVYEQVCLRDIAQFIEEETRRYRKNRYF